MRIVTLLALAAALATAPAASAQTCGDANDDDTVSVTDGVQALRAAAGLSTTCGEGCDVDGSGAITVTDGVNILRNAAGLTFTAACDFTGEEANDVVQPSMGIFDAIGKLPGIGGAAEAAGTTDCENDGTVDRTVVQASTILEFTECEIGGVILDGTVGRFPQGDGFLVGFQDFTLTRIARSRSLTFDGTLTVSDSTEGQRLAGTLNVVSSVRGAFTVRFIRVLLIKGGSPRDGELLYDLGDADGGKIDTILITFDTGNELAVRVQLRTGQVKQFTLDRRTRRLLLPL